MSSSLPDIGGLATIPVPVWTTLNERLRAAGFITQYPDSLPRPAMTSHSEALQRPVVIWHLRQRRDASACALRMFVFGDPVAIADAVEVFGRPLVDQLEHAGLLIRPDPGTVVSPLVLRVFRGLLILSDDLAHRGDAVFGTGYGTAAFCDLSSRRGTVASALDIGCGAGAVALWLCARAERVVATDVNPRALAFVKINAALNDISNVEIREGSLFDAVDGETFDVIMSQPPYVPGAPDLHPATYLFGGPRGDELVTALLAELPRHLRPAGRGMVVFEQPASADECVAHEEDGIEGEIHRLLIFGEQVDADAYSLRYASSELRNGIDAFDGTATAMRQHLHDVGISALCPAVAVMERATGSRGWSATLRAGHDLWNALSSEMIERLLASQTLLRQPIESPRQARLHIPTGSLLVRPLTGLVPSRDTIYLGLPAGYLVPSLELSQEEWEAVEACSRPGSLEQPSAALIAKAASAGLIDD